jgi:hypothetical protein
MGKTKNKEHSKKKKKTLPAIFCDIDGVVLKGIGANPILIGNSHKSIRRVLAPVRGGSLPSLPFTFMTNGGAVTEQAKCDSLNKLFGLDAKKEPALTNAHVNVCHTVFGSEQIQSEFADKFVLVDSSCKTGSSEVELAMTYGF